MWMVGWLAGSMAVADPAACDSPGSARKIARG